MAILEQINDARPSYLTGNRTSVSDDPDLIVLATMHGNDGMRLVSCAVTDEIILEATETQLLLTTIARSQWRPQFGHKHCTIIQRGDGYGYSLLAKPGKANFPISSHNLSSRSRADAASPLCD